MRNGIIAWFLAGLFQLLLAASAQAGTIGTTTIEPASTPAGVPLVVTVTSSITDPSVIPSTVNLQRLDASGRVAAVVGTLHDDGLNGDAAAGDKIYSITTTVLENIPGTLRFRVSAGFLGRLFRVFSAPVNVNITGTATGITISSPANAAYLNTPIITVSGTVGDPAAQVNVNGVPAPVSGNAFVTTVPLNEGPNTLTAVSANSNGTTSTASILVTLDTTPPHVDVYTPTNNTVTTDDSTDVTGLVNDIVVGTVNPQQATVTVNGVAAQVANRSFLAQNVPLSMGGNTIRAVAADEAGNSATASVTVTRQAQIQPALKIQSGNGQTGTIGTQLVNPLVVKLVTSDGTPVTNAPVVFRVTNEDGSLSSTGANGTWVSAIAVNSDTQGLASAFFTLGTRAGVGNNVVEASATGVATTAHFVASGTPSSPGLIVVDTGNNQAGVIGQPLPLPFIAIVTDSGNNRLAGVPVTFTVKNGGGNFAGKASYRATTDSDGRVQAILTLGPDAGVNTNVVEASFSGNLGYPAAFTATGLAPGPADQTRISGVVLDNSNNPIPGVTMHLYQIDLGPRSNLPTEVAQPVQTDANGQFLMQPVPVGVFKLMADGSTAQRAGSWPTLEYDMITVPGQDNTVGLPIYLPELLTQNRLCVDETTGGTLTIPQAPGFALSIAPGSATFPGGSRSGCVSVTPVNMDKVPMVPGFGQQPRFIVTIQPVGTMFNPPAALTIPNVDGLPPRAVTEMYSYDHDLASFVAIGSGTVSEDGSVIKSDPGVGVLKAGWHCGGNPNTSGSAGHCGDCKKCEGSQCVADAAQNGQQCENNNCKECSNGSCVEKQLSVSISSVNVCQDQIATTLTGNGTGTFTITLKGPQGDSVIVNAGRGAGSYVDSFEYSSLPENTEYTSIEAKWDVSGCSRTSTAQAHFMPLGVYEHTQYNTPRESDSTCSGTPVSSCFTTVTSQCSFSSGTLSQIFSNQVLLNGSGISNAHGTIVPEALALCTSNQPADCPGGLFREHYNIVPACHTNIGDTTVAASPADLAGRLPCGTNVCIRFPSGPVVKTVTDRCPACAGGHHLDNYTTDGRCTDVPSLPNAMTIKLY